VSNASIFVAVFGLDCFDVDKIEEYANQFDVLKLQAA